MMKPKVSIILTSYNKPDTVHLAIESVLAQKYDNWELLIMDDHSNDKTKRIIKGFLQDSRIQYFDSGIRDEDRHKTTRYATLINEALEKVSGDYISYLTDDDIYLPERLSEMTTILNNSPSYGVVYSKQLVRKIDQSGRTVYEKVRETNGILTKPQNLVDHCSVMHRASLLPLILAKYGSYWDDSPEYWHNGDAAFWARLAEWSPFYPIPKVLDICLKTPDSFQELNAFMPKELPTGLVVLSTNENTFLIDGNIRRKIDEAAFRMLKYDRKQLVKVHDPLLYQYREGAPIEKSVFSNAKLFPNYRFIKCGKSIFYTEGGCARPIESADALRRLKADLKDFILVAPEMLEDFQIGKPISRTFDQKNPIPEGKLFLYKRHFFVSGNGELKPMEAKVLRKLKYDKSLAIPLSKYEFASFPKGESLKWEVVRWKDKN